MAVMGRKKQMIANLIRSRQSKVSEELKERNDGKEKSQISEEEHQRKIKMLKELGLIKEE